MNPPAVPERGPHLVERLAAAGCVAPDLEANELLAAAPDDATLESMVRRRVAGEPLAWITGTTTFFGLTIRLDPGVYVPRPHTQELARRGASALPAGGRAVDLCSGSGAVAAALSHAVPSAHVVALDVDPFAARCARANGVTSVIADLAAPIPSASVDLVTAVAPYVPTSDLRLLPADVVRHEPGHALDGGPDGLDIVRRVIDDASRVLHAGGHLLVEIGGDQDVLLAGDLERAGFRHVATWCDEDGDLRGLAAARE